MDRHRALASRLGMQKIASSPTADFGLIVKRHLRTDKKDKPGIREVVFSCLGRLSFGAYGNYKKNHQNDWQFINGLMFHIIEQYGAFLLSWFFYSY